MTLPTDVERYVRRSFAEAERALELLGKAILHDGRPASPRLMRCALLNSRGDLEKLRIEVEQRQGGELVRVRDLNQPLGE